MKKTCGLAGMDTWKIALTTVREHLQHSLIARIYTIYIQKKAQYHRLMDEGRAEDVVYLD